MSAVIVAKHRGLKFGQGALPEQAGGNSQANLFHKPVYQFGNTCARAVVKGRGNDDRVNVRGHAKAAAASDWVWGLPLDQESSEMGELPGDGRLDHVVVWKT